MDRIGDIKINTVRRQTEEVEPDEQDRRDANDMSSDDTDTAFQCRSDQTADESTAFEQISVGPEGAEIEVAVAGSPDMEHCGK